MNARYITTADLKGACREQVDLFNETFGGKAKVTNRNLAKAMAAGLQVFWLESLIPAQAWAEYDKVRAPAWAEYDKVRAQAWAEYDKVRAQAWAEYDKVRAQAWAEYDKVTAKALVIALTGGAA